MKIEEVQLVRFLIFALRHVVPHGPRAERLHHFLPWFLLDRGGFDGFDSFLTLSCERYPQRNGAVRELFDDVSPEPLRRHEGLIDLFAVCEGLAESV